MKNEEELNDLERLYKDLGSDVLYCINQVKLQDQIYRRATVRSIFAMIEGVIYSLKQVVFGVAERRNIQLDSQQASLLREEVPELTDAGEIVTRAPRLTLKRNLQFAFRIFAEIHGIDERLDLSGTGWQNLNKSIKVRDRLMHPKKHADLQLSTEEIIDAVAGFEWFQRSFERFIVAATKATNDRIKKNGRRQC